MRQKLIPKMGQRWPLELSVLYARLGDRDKAYDYFVKSYRPNSRPPLVFSESANSNNPYFATGADVKPSYTVLAVEQTDMGLKYNKDFAKQWKS
jgi:hypothetical protein